MKLSITCLLVILFINSCTHQTHFPDKLSHHIPSTELELNNDFQNTNTQELATNKGIQALFEFVNLFEDRNVNFELLEFETNWKALKNQNNYLEWTDNDIRAWIKITGLLLELTGKNKYAQELENIELGTSNNFQKTIKPYVFTKQIDHIYVNLFQPIEINYKHTLGGEVKIKQETDYPNSGSVKLHFGMTERRYMELYIRIPSWADGTTVTVKQVKYFAGSGSYCKIAKKWKEGDLVEIQFPIHKKPHQTFNYFNESPSN